MSFNLGGNSYERDIEKISKADAAERKFYSLFWHRVYLWTLLILISVACAFVFPLVLKWFYHLLVDNGVWGFDAEDAGLLPDFLGGLCGILIAALLDSFIISRMEHLKKYEALVNVLNEEIKSIESIIFHKEPLKISNYIPLPNFESVSGSAEMLAIFYSIPRFFLTSKRISLVDEIRNITISLKNCNAYLERISKYSSDKITKDGDTLAVFALKQIHAYTNLKPNENTPKNYGDDICGCIREIRKAIDNMDRFKSVTIFKRK